MPHLTKRVVDALAPSKTKTGYFVWDDEIKGFGVRVMPSGRKTFLVQYRTGGRTQRYKLGVYGHVTADQAREHAKRILGDVASSENPADARAIHRKAPTLSDVCDQFMEQYVEVHLRKTTQREYKRCINLFVRPALGNHKIVDIDRSDITELHQKHKSIPYQANRTLGVLSKLFNMAEVWGYRADGSNPCRHVPKYPEKQRERFLSKEEIAQLWGVLDSRLSRSVESVYVVAAFKLLILTGCRLREIQTLRWENVKGPHIDLPDSKTGRRIVPLNDLAQDTLAAIPRLMGNPYVICGLLEGEHIADLERPWRRIRQEAGLDKVRIHDLRHTFASHAAASGVELAELMALTGHTQTRTALRYMHFAKERIRQTSNTIAASLTSQVKTSDARIAIGAKPALRLVKQ
jgi:integrase